MIRRIYLDVKQLLKSRVIQLLFVLVMIFSYFYTQTLSSSEDNDLSLIINELAASNEISYYRSYYTLSNTNIEDLNTFLEIGDDYYQKLITAIEEKDYETYRNLKVHQQILHIVPSENFYHNLSDYVINMYTPYVTEMDYVQTLKEKMGFDHEIAYISEKGLASYDFTVNWKVRYQYQYYLSKGQPIAATLKSSPASLLDYARTFHFIPLIVVAVIVSVYALYLDSRDGVVKTIIVGSSTRGAYLIAKIVAITIVSSLVTLVPPLLVSLYFSGKHFFSDMKIPLYVYKNTFTGFESFIHNKIKLQFSDVVNQEMDVIRVNLNYLPQLLFGAPVSEFVDNQRPVDFLRQLDLKPLYFYLANIALISTLMSSLIATITIFFTSLTKKRSAGIIATSVILIVLFGLTKIASYRSVLAYINPLTYLNIPALLEGSLPYTYLMALICLSVYCLIFTIGAVHFFKRKDIH